MRYGKLENGTLVLASSQFKADGTTILNIENDAELLAQYGFKPIIEANKPDYPYILSYEEDAEKITEVITRDTEKEAAMEAARAAELQKQFFYTSLGYIRRTVSMKDGRKIDFLTGLVPVLKAAFLEGKNVSILTYTADGQQQSKKLTSEFFTECENQLYIDFYGESYEAEQQESEE